MQTTQTRFITPRLCDTCVSVATWPSHATGLHSLSSICPIRRLTQISPSP